MILLHIITNVVVFTLFYIIGAFISWELNPANWGLAGRLTFVMVVGGVMIWFNMVAYAYKKGKKCNEQPSQH